MRSFLLPAALGVIALSLLLAEPPGLQACPPTAWFPSYGGYASGWYYPVYPVYSGGYYRAYASDRQVPGVTQTRAYYYDPQTSGAATPQGRVPYSVPAPLAPPAYSGYYNLNPSQSPPGVSITRPSLTGSSQTFPTRSTSGGTGSRGRACPWRWKTDLAGPLHFRDKEEFPAGHQGSGWRGSRPDDRRWRPGNRDA